MQLQNVVRLIGLPSSSCGMLFLAQCVTSSYKVKTCVIPFLHITNTTMMLGDVSFITNITVEIASIYGSDLEIILTSPTGDEEYILMLDTVAIEGPDDIVLEDYDLGTKAGNPRLRNVGNYTFVETGGLAGFTSPYSPPDVYNADTWASSGGPFSAGDWNFLIRDNAAGDPC